MFFKSDWLGGTKPLCSRTNCSLGVTSGCQLPSNGPICLSMVFRTPLWGEFLSSHLERCVWRFYHQRDKWTCLLLAKLGFFLQGLHRPIWRKDTIAWNSWRITSRGFFLNGTWSWPRRCSSNISSCLKVVGGNTHNVDVWLSLSNWLRLVNRWAQNNPWRDPCAIPNDPTRCRFLLSLKLGQDEQDMEKGCVWRVVRDSCRVVLLLLVLDWRETPGIYLDRIRLECLWRRRRLITIFSLQGISYVFLHEQTSRRVRSVLVLIFQELFLTFSFQGKGSDPRRVVFFVG